jgi:hypothetical protein
MEAWFEVTKPTTSWLTAFLDILSAGTGGGSGDYRGEPPTVAVLNARGERLVLEVLDTMEQANERLETIRAEFESLELGEWCGRYEVPETFFDEDGS